MSEGSRRAFTVEARESGWRLDVWLAAQLGASRAQVRRELARGAVSVDGHEVDLRAKGRPLQVGTRVEVSAFTPPEHQTPIPEPEAPLQILAQGAGWVAVDKPAGERCYTLGPFRDMKALRLLTREIKDYVIEASFRSREEQEQSMFRVYLKPVGSKKEARALIKQLDSKKIRDHFIIIEGPLKNGISLGYFSDKRRHTSMPGVSASTASMRSSNRYSGPTRFIGWTTASRWAMKSPSGSSTSIWMLQCSG